MSLVSEQEVCEQHLGSQAGTLARILEHTIQLLNGALTTPHVQPAGHVVVMTGAIPRNEGGLHVSPLPSKLHEPWHL